MHDIEITYYSDKSVQFLSHSESPYASKVFSHSSQYQMESYTVVWTTR